MKRHTLPWLTASVTAVTIAVYSVLEQGLSHPPTNAVLRQDGAITAWGHCTCGPWCLLSFFMFPPFMCCPTWWCSCLWVPFWNGK